ncbi:hypothetical protein EZL74_11620 [Flavobacterium silvisoli]|uniref:Pycsar effector protein domain-containing protein n=1 Tax=Flavobacterium silvisoli TaxID=2529433 RepID=A0A4Q9YT22_9FLAO|nr:Pycsar system effector family protein [Flavobacterium silvisoli]TBX65776.1 hypothetical protein EZL74_11620 [Flavobacterium silvisoli]
MKTIDYLEKQYGHAFEMLKFGEAKNIALIAFNGAIIVGISKLITDTINPYLSYYLYYAIAMSCITIFISFSALVAKIKHSPNNMSLHRSNNLLFYATLAHMTDDELIKKISESYECERSNENHEKDLANQVIITSQIAARKFKLYNIAITIMFMGLLTPLSYIIYKLFLDQDK